VDLVDRTVMARLLKGFSELGCAVLYFSHAEDTAGFTREIRLDEVNTANHHGHKNQENLNHE